MPQVTNLSNSQKLGFKKNYVDERNLKTLCTEFTQTFPQTKFRAFAILGFKDDEDEPYACKIEGVDEEGKALKPERYAFMLYVILEELKIYLDELKIDTDDFLEFEVDPALQAKIDEDTDNN